MADTHVTTGTAKGTSCDLQYRCKPSIYMGAGALNAEAACPLHGACPTPAALLVLCGAAPQPVPQPHQGPGRLPGSRGPRVSYSEGGRRSVAALGQGAAAVPRRSWILGSVLSKPLPVPRQRKGRRQRRAMLAQRPARPGCPQPLRAAGGRFRFASLRLPAAEAKVRVGQRRRGSPPGRHPRPAAGRFPACEEGRGAERSGAEGRGERRAARVSARPPSAARAPGWSESRWGWPGCSGWWPSARTWG